MEKEKTMKEQIPMELRPKVRFWLPGAAMNEEDLRAEIRSLAQRGFGGIEAVVLQSLPKDVLLSEDAWGSKNWNRMTEIIDDEAKKLGMSVDYAAGPGWPVASPVLLSADDPGTLCELTYGYLELEGGTHYDGPLPVRRTVRPEGTPVRIAVMAYRCDTSDPEENAKAGTKVETAFGERTYHLPLIFDSYVNLDEAVTLSAKGADASVENNAVSGGERLVWDVPGDPEEKWMLFAFWYQPAVQKINGGNTYVVDHLSAEGTKAVTDYWEPVLESQACASMESLFCDSLEYDVAADWTPKLPEFFRARRGYDLIPYLPFIGMVNTFPAGDVPAFPSSPAQAGIQVNNDYMEMLTQLYCEEHLGRLEKAAEKYGKTVRYQVAYNKPFEEERCGLYVALPENEALGRSQLDGQRLMAAAAHFGRKERYSFECAAEFGQCYGQGYEDLLWWVKRSLMAGMNAQVLHGASYSGVCSGTTPENSLMKNAEWPGYEGFGKYITNNWNRTPDIRHARGCMDAVSRLNGVFRGRAQIDLCIFRQAYENNGNGPDFYLYDDGGLLMNMGYSYEYVSDYLLHLPQAAVTDGELDREGAAYRALIVPHQERMSQSAMSRILRLAEQGFPVVLIGKAPAEPYYYSECRTEELRKKWQESRGLLWNPDRGTAGGKIAYAAGLSDVPAALAFCGVRPRAELEHGGDVMTAVRLDCKTGGEKEEAKRIWYVLYGYNRIHTGEGFTGPGDADPKDVKPVYQRPGSISARIVETALSGRGKVFRYDPWTGECSPEDFIYDGAGRMRGKIRIEEDEMVVLYLQGAGTQGEQAAEGMEETEESAGRSAEKPSETVLSPVRAGRIEFQRFSFYEFGPDAPGETSFLRSSFSAEPTLTRELCGKEDLIPWHEMDPSLEYAAGAGVYEGTLTVERMPGKGERLILDLGDVYDTFTVKVNGKETPFPDQVMKRVDVTGMVKMGENRIEVRVVSELHNRLIGGNAGKPLADGMPRPVYVPRRYGICPSEEKPAGVYLL